MNQDVAFYKLSATGNDFILFDNRDGRFTGGEEEFFKEICERRKSVGADGILLLEQDDATDYRLRYFNADGREAEMCGNGARSAAFYAYHSGIAPQTLSFHIGAAIYGAEDLGDETVAIDLGRIEKRVVRPEIFERDAGGSMEAGFVTVGVPHYVIFSNNLWELDIRTLGEKYRKHDFFHPAGTNVNFVQKGGDNEIHVRTYERGVESETLSCGTGCVASALLAYEEMRVESPIRVRTLGGDLTVDFSKDWDSIRLSGRVKLVYEGRLSPSLKK